MDALTFFPNEVVTQQTSSIFQSKKVDVEPERVCTQCGSTDTPLWRRGPHGPKSMCNRCGIRWKRKEDKKAGKKPNSNKKKKESTPKAKKIRTSSDREFLSSSSLSPTHDSDSWLSELDDEEETDFNTSVLSARAKVTMGSETSEPMYTDHKEPHLTVNLTPQGESFTVDDGLFARPEVPEPRRLSRDFININSSINYRNDTEPHDGMSLRKRKAKPRSTDFDYEWNAPSTSSPARRKSRQEAIDEQLRNLPNHTRMFLEQAEAELNRIRKEEKENAEIVRLNQLLQQVQSENNELRQQNMQKDAVVSSLQEQLHKAQQHAQAVAMFPGFRPFPGMYTNAIQLLPHEIQRVNLLPQSMH